jgi:hypothetical protein
MLVSSTTCWGIPAEETVGGTGGTRRSVPHETIRQSAQSIVILYVKLALFIRLIMQYDNKGKEKS